MDVIISNSSNVPIYKQIVDQIKEQIIKGELKEGDALPSMRYLAMELRISLITTKRAYEELESLGFIESYTGKGSFVKSQNMDLIREEHLKNLEDHLKKAYAEAVICGIGIDEIKELLDIIGDENS